MTACLVWLSVTACFVLLSVTKIVRVFKIKWLKLENYTEEEDEEGTLHTLLVFILHGSLPLDYQPSMRSLSVLTFFVCFLFVCLFVRDGVFCLARCDGVFCDVSCER